MQFDDLLTKFLPNFDPESDPSIRVSATLSHFLSHRSGLANPQILFCGPESLPLQPEKNFVDFVNAFPTRTLDGQQRLDQHWNYTNAGYALPALALQEVYKCRYSTFVQERILQPLGMTRTAVTRSAAIDDENIAFPYARLSNSSFAKLDSTHITDENNTPILAAMGMRSSVNDLLKWCQFFLSSSSKNPNYFSKSSITATNLDVSTASKASTSFSPSSSSPSSSASTSFSASSSSSFSGSNLRGHQTIMDISFSQIPQIHSCQWTWNPNTPHFSSYCLGWMRTDLPSSKLGKHTYNSAARHPSRKDRSYPPIIGTSSPSRPVFQSCGIMNGAACSISLFPSDECAIVACANGNTDGDAADWATKLLMQALFDLEPKTDFVALAQEEALARQEDYERILGDWRRVGPERRGDTDNGQLISSEYETKDSNAMKSNVQHDTEDVNTMDTSLLPQPFAGLYPISFLDSYSGTYRGLGSTIGITYSSSSDFHLSTLVATFNDIPASRQQLRWHKKDCWSWFPPTRDEWLLRGMIDWDFWATGVFEFVRESTGGKEKSSALLWQWDEGEEATRFERVL
jgi:CubicO group peptidase (beta-lactamase class C family)